MYLHMTNLLHILRGKIYYIIINPRQKNTQQESVQIAYTDNCKNIRKSAIDKKGITLFDFRIK